MDMQDMLQKLLEAEVAKITAPAATPEPKVEEKGLDIAALSASIAEVVEKALDARIKELEAKVEPKGTVAEKASTLESDPATFIAAKAAKGEDLTDTEKRVAWEMTKRVLGEGLR